MSAKSLPEKLYKFRAWDNEYHRKLLTDSELYFSSMASFNDPFEGVIPVRYDLLTRNEIIKIATGLVRHKYKWLKGKKAKSFAKRKLAKSPHYYKDFDIMAEIQKEYRDQYFGIFSLTEDPNNIVMWSHYSNSHKGVCIGLDPQKLNKFLEKTFFTHDKLIIDLYKVEYKDEFPLFERDKMNLEDTIMRSLFTKSKYWEYEKEWRLISISGRPNFPLVIAEGIICEVILGCRISDKSKEEIIKLLCDKEIKIPLYQASVSKSAFSLDFREIEY